MIVIADTEGRIHGVQRWLSSREVYAFECDSFLGAGGPEERSA